jgi:hypothetical protein
MIGQTDDRMLFAAIVRRPGDIMPVVFSGNQIVVGSLASPEVSAGPQCPHRRKQIVAIQEAADFMAVTATWAMAREKSSQIAAERS